MLTEARNRVATITGFADSQGEEADNLMLSRQRAGAVEEYLVGKGIEQERLQVAGQGSNYNFADAEVSRAALAAEDFRIVTVRISSDSGAPGNK
jgi:outer membrane protein OmpA-like peptidoglycan-associated protein